MQQANTYRHWAAFSVAQYYEKYQRACRIRDLYPLVEDVFETPRSLNTALQYLRDAELIGHKQAEMASVVYAYYPIKPTIEELRELGAPTKLPDGSPIPDGADLTLPTDRVTDDDEVEALTDKDTPSPFDDGWPDDIARSDTRVAVADAPDTPDDEDEYECDVCGDTFSSPNKYGGHMSGHARAGDTADDGGEDEDDDPPVELGTPDDPPFGEAMGEAMSSEPDDDEGDEPTDEPIQAQYAGMDALDRAKDAAKSREYERAKLEAEAAARMFESAGLRRTN